jgi:hypothetical protein
MLQAPSSLERRAACALISGTRNESSRSTLWGILESDRDIMVRVSAVRSIGIIGTRSDRLRLEGLLHSIPRNTAVEVAFLEETIRTAIRLLSVCGD